MIAFIEQVGGTPVAQTMTDKHPRWGEFCSELEELIDLQFAGGCKHDHRHAKWLLGEMRMDVPSSLQWCRNHGGYCDCEILMNCCHE